MKKTPHLTVKQLELLRVIAAGNEDGTKCDLDEVLERIRYCTTKDSLHFSLRLLIERGLVEKLPFEQRRGAKRRIVGVTPEGQAAGGTNKKSALVEQDNIVELGIDLASVSVEVVPDIEVVPDFIAPGGL